MIDWSLLHPAEARAAAAMAALRDRIKARRDVAITGGLHLEGMAIATDDVSQQRLTAAALAALLDPDLVLQWKLPDGRFIPLQAAQVIAIAQAVRAHVQACFDHEAQLLAALAAGGPADAEIGWPGASVADQG